MYYDKTCNKRKYLRRMAWGKKGADKESVFALGLLTVHLSLKELFEEENK